MLWKIVKALERSSSTRFVGGCVNLRPGLDTVEKGNISLPLTVMKPYLSSL
jgi:hypothetical protein